MNPAPPSPIERIWSLPVRLAHWGVAALVLFNLFNDSGAKVHRYAGYAAAGLVVLRTLHGLFTRHVPERLHLPGPRAMLAHARAMSTGRPPRVAGHNPLGAAMALLLWALVIGLALSGWLSRLDRYWGADWPIDIHSSLALALQICVLLHLAGVALSSLLERQNLVAAMFHGRKRVDAASAKSMDEDVPGGQRSADDPLPRP